MKCMSRGGLIAGLTFALLGLGSPRPVEAQLAVACVNCSSTFTQLLEYARQMQQLQAELQSAATQMQQYQNMIQNTASVPSLIYSDAMGDMQRIQNLLNQGSQLSFTNNGSSMGTFSSFLNNAGYAGGNMAVQAAQFSVWSNRAKDGITAAMSAIAAQNGQLASDDATMTGLQVQAGASTGQMQAMQNAGQIAAQGVRESQKLRQLVMVQVQLEANKQQNESERAAAGDAAMSSFINVPPVADAGQIYR
jgi:P-type conjugative transfer protein TrbJ